jgi:2-amino-4-hydroxy-6-hydroxymethyldihydropteridine diphosphokinase
MPIAYVGLGSNMGNKTGNILKALELLDHVDNLTVLKRSSFYETEPIGYEDQDWFVNAVAQLDTSLSPQQLLNEFMKVEQSMGRKHDVRWGPREIDLDLLLYDQLCIDSLDLVIPHPRMHERAFVLVPFAEIASDITHPVFSKTISELLKEIHFHKNVRLMTQSADVNS